MAYVVVHVLLVVVGVRLAIVVSISAVLAIRITPYLVFRRRLSCLPPWAMLFVLSFLPSGRSRPVAAKLNQGFDLCIAPFLDPNNFARLYVLFSLKLLLFSDYLQAPLQPLMDNLESQTYEAFEKDPVKYRQYERAIAKALELEKEKEGVDTTVLMVRIESAGEGLRVHSGLDNATAVIV